MILKEYQKNCIPKVMEALMNGHHFFTDSLNWIGKNKEWLFSGGAVTVLTSLFYLFLHIARHIHKHSQDQPKLNPDLPFGKNNNFTGRAKDLRRLHHCLQKNKNTRIAGITGPGGIGKTELAAAYAHTPRYKQCYPQGIFWVSAGRGIEAGLVEFCANYGLVKDISTEELKREAVRVLYRDINGRPKSLLILDNLDHPQDTEDIFDQLSTGQSIRALKCKILFTTRCKVETQDEIFRLDVMEPDDCLKLFTQVSKRSKKTDRNYSRSICEALGRFPLAIIQAGAFLYHEEEISLESYLDRIQAEGALKTVDMVETALKFSWEKIKNNEDRFVMKVAALFPESSDIPLKRLSYASGLSLNSSKPGYTAPLVEIINNLFAWRLIEKPQPSRIRLHPLVREFVNKRMQVTDEINTRIEQSYLNTFQSPDVLVEIIKEQSIYGLINELQIAVILLSDNSRARPVLAELSEALRKNAYQITNWPFGNRGPAKDSMEDYIYQFLWYSVYFTGLQALKLNLERYFSVETGTRRLLNQEPAPHLEHNETLILTGHKSGVNHAEFSPDGKRVISCSGDNSIRIWDVETGRQLLKMIGHKAEINHVTFSNDGKKALSCSGGTSRINDCSVCLWDTATGMQLHKFTGYKAKFNHVTFSPDDKLITAGSDDGTAYVWNAKKRKRLLKLTGHKKGVIYTEFSPDGKKLITCSGDSLSNGDEHKVCIWNLETGELLFPSIDAHFARFSPDGSKIISCSFDGVARIWDANTGDPVGKGLTNPDYARSLLYAEFSKDGKKVVSCSGFDYDVYIWDAENHTLLFKLTHQLRGAYARFSNDGKRVVTCTYYDKKNIVSIWDAETGNLIFELTGHESDILKVAFSQDDLT